MTIPVQNPVIEYDFTGPGEYEFDFYIMAANTLVVQHYIENESIITLIPNQDYTVSFSEDGPGKITVTYDPPEYGVLRILRKTDKAQKTDYLNGGAFDQEILERDFDRIYMILQELSTTFEISGVSNWRGEWQPDTAYMAHDVVSGPAGTKFEYSLLTCIVDHVSSDNFEDDFNAGLWRLSFDLVDLTELLEEAKEAMEQACACRDQACDCAIAACNCKTDAETAATTAEQHAISAGESVSLADEAAACAQKWSSEEEDVPIDCGGHQGYSAYHWAQKAGQGGITTITSSDPDVCAITEPDARTRHLIFNTDQASGLPKLDQNGKIKIEQLPVMGLQFYGGFIGHDNCPKEYSTPPETSCTEPDYRNPSELWPSVTFPNGSYFIVTSPTSDEDPGHVNVINDDGSGHIQVVSGDALMYSDGTDGHTPGWYHVPNVVQGGGIAAEVLFDDSNTVIKGTNLQIWCENADGVITGKVDRSGDTMSGDLEIEKDDPALILTDVGQSSFKMSGETGLNFYKDNTLMVSMATNMLKTYGYMAVESSSDPYASLVNSSVYGVGSQWRTVVDASGNFKIQYWNGISWSNLFTANPDTGQIDFSFDIDAPNWDGGGGDPGTGCECVEEILVTGNAPHIRWDRGSNTVWRTGMSRGTNAWGIEVSINGGAWVPQMYSENGGEMVFGDPPRSPYPPTEIDALANKWYVDNKVTTWHNFESYIEIDQGTSAPYLNFRTSSGKVSTFSCDNVSLAFFIFGTMQLSFDGNYIYCWTPTQCNAAEEDLTEKSFVPKSYIDSRMQALNSRVQALEDRISILENK